MQDPQRFGALEIRHSARRLLVAGAVVEVGARAFDVLSHLARHHERVVPRRELLEAVWPRQVVQENNLAVQVNALRKALGRGTILTVPGHGYRFMGGDESAPPGRGSQPRPGTAGGIDAASFPAHASDAPDPRLIGRRRELEELRTLVRRHRLVTLAGAGGVGKSTLARALREQPCADPQSWSAWIQADAAVTAGQGDVALAVAVGLRLELGGEASVERVAEALAGAQAFIVIDGCETRVDDVARLAAAILRAAPGVRLLATSQASLRLPEERIMFLAPLPLPPAGLTRDAAPAQAALGLFIDRARRHDARFDLPPDDVDAAAAICRRLDGLPLAIELAAARVPLLGVRGVERALDERLQWLTSRRRDAAPNQLSLRAALRWSHELLEPAARLVLRRLSTCAGMFGLDLAQDLCADATLDATAVANAVGVLVDRSWLQVQPAALPRYRLLESPLAFAAEQLDANGEATECRARHARAMRRIAVDLRRRTRAGRIRADAAAALLELDFDNLRRAHAWAMEYDAETAIDLTPSLHVLLQYSSFSDSRALWTQTAPLMAQVRSLAVRADWLLACGRFWAIRDEPLMHRHALEAIELYAALDDPLGLYLALSLLLYFESRQGGDGVQTLARMRALADAGLPPSVLLAGAQGEGLIAAAAGRHDDAVRAFERARGLAEESGYVDLAITAQLNIAESEALARRFRAAIARGRAAAEALRGSRKRGQLGIVLLNLCGALLAAGEVAQARQVAQEGLFFAAQIDLLPHWADHLGLLAALEGRAADGARLLGFGDGQYGASGGARGGLELRSASAAQARLLEAFTPAEFERLRLEGRGLTIEGLTAVAFRGGGQRR